jgi:GNAT superfamily N-acetyltransferase
MDDRPPPPDPCAAFPRPERDKLKSDEELVVRSARRSDAAYFVKLVRELADYEKLEPPGAGETGRLVRDGFGRDRKFSLLMAFRGKEAVGYCVYFMTYSTFLARPTLYVEDIFVSATERRNGVGSRIFLKIIDIALKKGCGRIEWMVLNWNGPAISFYERMGARPLDGWRHYRLVEKQFRPAAAVIASGNAKSGEAGKQKNRRPGRAEGEI